MPSSSSQRLLSLFLSLVLPLLAGCSFSSLNAPSSPGAAFRGRLQGGQQPIVGAHLYLFAANTTGYGQTSVSLLNAALTGNSDALGAYVTSDAAGSFSITGDYGCTPNTQVYVYASGGNSGSGFNAAVGLLAALGSCPLSGNFLTVTPYIVVNEVSTVAAAYSISGFATDATHVSSSGTALAQTGIANAFANASNLANLPTGTALLTTPTGGTVTQKQTNLLADILASCVNSTGAVTGPANPSPCYTLFHAASSDGSASGTIPAETASAAINIAHHPSANIAALYALASAASPFQPVAPTQPLDFTETITFAGLSTPIGIAIDGFGDVWLAAAASESVVELSSLGAFLSPVAGYTGGGIYEPDYIAIDPAGNAWVANHEPGVNPPGVVKLSPSGAALSPSEGFTGGGLNTLPTAIASDGSGNAWVVDTGVGEITEFSSAGVPLSPATAFRGGGLNSPESIAMDSNGNAWLGSYSSISEFSPAGIALSPTNGFRGGGLAYAFSIAVDHANNIWVGNAEANSSPSSRTRACRSLLRPASRVADLTVHRALRSTATEMSG